MNPFIAFLENTAAHWFGGAKKVAVDTGKLLAPLAHELSTLAHDDALTLVATGGASLLSNSAAVASGTMKPSDALHAAGTAIKSQAIGMTLNLSDEAIAGLVATASAARKQAADSAASGGLDNPPKTDAGTAQAGTQAGDGGAANGNQS